jgi:branched-subunit amino acid ABC-type transport system permease component
MLRLILVLSGVLAALVAITRSMATPVDVQSGLSITVFALIVTVVGGLGSVAGALLAGIILGVVNVIAADLIGTYVSLIILLTAAAVTILIRPAGLLGVKE